MKKLFLIFMSVILFSSCSTSDDVAMKIGNVEIKKEFIEYFEKSFNTQSGGTISEEVSKKALNRVELYGNVTEIAKQMKLELDDEYNKRVEAVVKNYGSIEKYLELAGISKDMFDFLMYGTSSQTLVLEEFIKSMGISSKSVDEYFKNNFFRAKHLLLLTEDKTGREKAELKKKIDEILKKAQNGSDFDKLIEKYNEDPGIENVPDGYVFTYNEMVQEFFNAVTGIEVGEYAVVETAYGYHVVKRLALDETPELYEKFKQEKHIDICQALIADKYFRENFWRVKQIYLSVKDNTGNEISVIKDKAEEIYDDILSGADFNELIAEYNEDENASQNPNGYVFTYDEMPSEFFDAATSIEIGDYNFVETMYGFHIIKRLPLDETPEIYSELKNSKLEKIYKQKEVSINELFLDYIQSKLQEYNIITRDFTENYYNFTHK